MVCSAHSALIAVLGRPWRHTGHFGPRTARTRDAHEVPSPSPASEHNRCPLVHCSMRPCGASVSRVQRRPRRALSHMTTSWRCERGGVPKTVRPTRTPHAGKEFDYPIDRCTHWIPLGPRAREETRSPPSPRHTAHFRCSGTPSWSSSTSPLPRVRPRFASVSTALLIFRGACVLLLLLLLREGAFVSFLTLPKTALPRGSHVKKQPSGKTLRVPRRLLRQRDRWVPAPLTPRTRRRRRARREQRGMRYFCDFLKS